MSDFITFLSAIRELSNRFLAWVESIDWDKVTEVIEYIQHELPEQVKALFIELANRGWFVWEMDKPLGNFVEFISAIMDKDQALQDEFISRHVERELNAIEAELLVAYADRSIQIKDAFAAHRSELYGASVPALIALSEGICRDHYPGIGLYSKHPNNKNRSKKPGTPKTDDIFDEIPPLEVWEEMVLKPLRVTSDVTKSIHNPTEEEHKMFNRHLIMHGASKNYGNKTNSLKAVSLVRFVHGSLSYLANKSPSIKFEPRQ